jgi:DNA-binding MarR family transcriptional regulator
MSPKIEGNFSETLHLVSALNRTLSSVRENELKPLGITAPQSAILHRIYNLGDNATISNIAEGVQRDLSSVLSMLSRLESHGLVKKFNNPNDRRQVFAFLTEKGRKIHAHVRNTPDAFTRIGNSLGEDFICDLNNSLRRLNAIGLEENQRISKEKAEELTR